jgi:hypothetical protein
MSSALRSSPPLLPVAKTSRTTLEAVSQLGLSDATKRSLSGLETQRPATLGTVGGVGADPRGHLGRHPDAAFNRRGGRD